MHCVGNAPGFWSPAMPFQVLRTCATVHMRPPLSHGVHFRGGLIPAMGDHVNKARAGPLRVSASADMILSENKEAANVEDGTPWFLNISMSQIFGLFLKFAVALACAGVLVFMFHLGITHYQNVYQFVSGSATGHVITCVSAVVGFAATLVYAKIETTQAETKKDLQRQSKQLTAAQAENSKRFDASDQKLDLVLSSVAPEMAAMKTNIAWMRGDYGVVNRGHRPSNEATKPSTDEPLEDDDSFAGTNP
ncbi:hypothetical protein Ndes2437A_g04729 [Nannochloris sp. 'desiccata']